MNRLTIPAFLSVLLSIAPLLTSSFVTYEVLVNEPVLADFSAWQWAAVTLICVFTSAFALTPPTFLALVFGYFLGWHALFPLFALNMAAILLVNVGVRWFDQDRLRDRLEHNPRVRQVLARIRQEELKVIFFTKISPVLPFAVTNLVFALSGARLRNVLLGGFLGMVPRTALAVWAGSQARVLRTLLENPNGANWTQWVLISLIVVSAIGLWRVLRK